MAELEPLELEMTVKLADEYDADGRRLTAVDELINETIAGDARLAILSARADAATWASWEAVARDLARQAIDAEAEIAELDEKLEEQYEEGIDAITGSRDLLASQVNRLLLLISDEEQAHCETYVEALRLTAEIESGTLASRLDELEETHCELANELAAEEKAHCDTYVEAVRLSEELAGWQNSSHAEYRRSTAAARLANYTTTHNT